MKFAHFWEISYSLTGRKGREKGEKEKKEEEEEKRKKKDGRMGVWEDGRMGG